MKIGRRTISGKKSSMVLKAVTAMVLFIMAMPVIPAQVITDLSGVIAGPEANLRQIEIGPMGPLVGDYPAVVNTTTDDWATWTNGQRNVVRANNGTLHTVYREDGEIWYSQSWDDGVTWVNHTNISNTGRNCWGPAIATNGTTLHVVYGDDDDIRYRRSLNGGATWTPDTSQDGVEVYDGGPGLPDGHYASVAAIGQWVYVVHGNNNNWWNSDIRIQRSNDGGQTWFPSVQLTNNGNIDDWYPSIDVEGNSVFVAFMQETGGGNADYEVITTRSDNNGANWGTWRQITNNNDEDVYPSIDVFNDNVTVAWSNDDRGNWEVFVTNSTDRTTNWNTPINVSNTTDDSIYPSVVRTNTVSYVIWQDDGHHATGDIYFAKHVNNVWSTPIDLTDSDQGNVLPNAVPNIYNNWLGYTYAENEPDPNNVVFNRYYVGPNNAPALGYTGETGYASDGLDPEGDTTGHTYTYRIKYTDSNNDPPITGYPEVWIDRNLDGDYNDANETYSMTEVNAQDTTYTDGKLYTFSTTFSDLGTYKYTFRAFDSKGWKATGNPNNDHTGPAITQYNVPPILEWLETINYEDDGLDPETGMMSDTFRYMIRYRDTLDDPPGADFPKVQIDVDNNGQFNDTVDEEYSMVEVTSQDTSYDNGKIYYYDHTFTQTGTFGYKFITEDSVGLTAETESRTGPVVEVATQYPELTYTGEPGYETDGADPDIGSTNTVFTFRVVYTDADGDAPENDEVLIGIDTNFTGAIEPAEWIVMVEDDAADTNFTDGKIYEHTTTFGSMAVYNYTFYAKDTPGAVATGAATAMKSVNVNIDNIPPVLKFTLEDNYTSDGLHPETGTANLTEFVYRIKYEDANDNAPVLGHPQVGIDMNMNGTFEADEWFAMEEVSANDTTYTDGKLYKYTHIFDDIGDYTYTFRAKDTWDFATGTPTGVFDGPSIADKYVETFPPVLYWTGAIGYESDAVEPSSGTTLTEFEFKITYKDVDNDLPGTGPTLWVDMDGDGLFNGTADQSFTMTEVDANDTDVTDGKVYEFKQAFTTTGEYAYTMEVTSSRAGEAAFGPNQLTGTFTVSRSNTAPTLAFAGTDTNGVDPDEGIPGAQFTYKMVYTDVDGDAPATGFPKVSIDLNGNGAFEATETFVMVAADTTDTNYKDGKEYRHVGVVFNIEGTFKSKFTAKDNLGATATDLEGTGPTVSIIPPNEMPKLIFPADANFKFDGLDPIKGKKDTVFHFRVTYIDADGDEPQVGNPQLWIDKNRDGDFDDADEKVSMDAEGSADVVTGRTYKKDLSLEPFEKDDKAYKYAFYVINSANQTVKLGDFEGPLVLKMGTDTTTGDTGSLGDLLWILLVIIAAVICLIIGYFAGKPKAQPTPEDTEPQYREGGVAMSTMPEDEPEAEAEPEPEPEPESEPEAEEEIPDDTPSEETPTEEEAPSESEEASEEGGEEPEKKEEESGGE